MRYKFHILHVPGAKHKAADAMSRYPSGHPTKQRGSDAEADFRRIQNVVTKFRTPDPKCFRKFRIKFDTRKLEAPLFQLSTYISIPLIRLK